MIDGPGGSGKTTLAARVQQLTGAPVVHMDDLYDGWDGLDRVDAQLATLLEPLARGEAGSYRRYDWYAAGFVETCRVDPVPLLVVEGVGSSAAAYDHLATLRVWVEAPPDVRRERALLRDGPAMVAPWEGWRVAEAAHLARQRTRERADVVLDGTARLGT